MRKSTFVPSFKIIPSKVPSYVPSTFVIYRQNPAIFDDSPYFPGLSPIFFPHRFVIFVRGEVFSTGHCAKSQDATTSEMVGNGPSRSKPARNEESTAPTSSTVSTSGVFSERRLFELRNRPTSHHDLSPRFRRSQA